MIIMTFSFKLNRFVSIWSLYLEIYFYITVISFLITMVFFSFYPQQIELSESAIGGRWISAAGSQASNATGCKGDARN